MTELPILDFRSPAELRTWLDKNHTLTEGVWIRLFKKSSGQLNMTYDEMLDELLCYGWIDGLAKSENELSYLQRITPRRKGSVWSKRNVGRIYRLIEEGLMKPAGLAEIEKAKANGRWNKAY